MSNPAIPTMPPHVRELGMKALEEGILRDLPSNVVLERVGKPERVTCAHCGAAKGKPCRTPRGATARTPHKARVRATSRVVGSGRAAPITAAEWDRRCAEREAKRGAA